MAIVKCRECGHELSNEAGYCPHCGSPAPNDSGSSQVASFIALAFMIFFAALIAQATFSRANARSINWKSVDPVSMPILADRSWQHPTT
jgi:hypothetical protein